MQDNWRAHIAQTTRDLAFEFNHAMSQDHVHEAEYVQHSYQSQSWGQKYPFFRKNAKDGGLFQVSVMSQHVCYDFAAALKRAQWPVDRVETEQWGCGGVQPFTCRIYWKKTEEPTLPDKK